MLESESESKSKYPIPIILSTMIVDLGQVNNELNPILNLEKKK